VDIENDIEYLKQFYKQLERQRDKLRPWRDTFLLSLVKARYKRGWSQAELARRAGIQQPAISRLERGHGNPNLVTLLKLAKALDVNLVLE
jgi:ribosome-binding protein aMBF1 (putative translation factor)